MEIGFNLNCRKWLHFIREIALFCLYIFIIAEPEDCKPRRIRELQNIYNTQQVAMSAPATSIVEVHSMCDHYKLSQLCGLPGRNNHWYLY